MGGQRSQRAIFSISAFCQSLYYTIHHTLLYTLKYLSPYSNLHLLVTYTLKYLTITDNPPAVTRQILTNIKGFPPGRSARSSLHISGVGGNNVLLYLTFVEFGGFSVLLYTTPQYEVCPRHPDYASLLADGRKVIAVVSSHLTVLITTVVTNKLQMSRSIVLPGIEDVFCNYQVLPT